MNLENFCNENFNDPKNVFNTLMEYKKILLNENHKMNLIGKSTIDDFDQRHIIDCIQIIKHMPDKKTSYGHWYWSRFAWCFVVYTRLSKFTFS